MPHWMPWLLACQNWPVAHHFRQILTELLANKLWQRVRCFDPKREVALFWPLFEVQKRRLPPLYHTLVTSHHTASKLWLHLRRLCLWFEQTQFCRKLVQTKLGHFTRFSTPLYQRNQIRPKLWLPQNLHHWRPNLQIRSQISWFPSHRSSVSWLDPRHTMRQQRGLEGFWGLIRDRTSWLPPNRQFASPNLSERIRWDSKFRAKLLKLANRAILWVCGKQNYPFYSKFEGDSQENLRHRLKSAQMSPRFILQISLAKLNLLFWLPGELSKCP